MSLDDLNTIQSEALGNKVPTDIAGFINVILPYVFGAASMALLVYLILGGFQLMTSRGDPKAAQGAQGKITNAVIGFVIIIFAYFIVQIFGRVFGIENTLFGQIFK
jgi:hypothetical protein